MKGEETKRTFLLLPPAQVGAVQSIGVTAITVSNDRSGRHWGIRTCWWFWRGSKVSASCSAWSGRKEKSRNSAASAFTPSPISHKTPRTCHSTVSSPHRIYCLDLCDHASKHLSATETSDKSFRSRSNNSCFKKIWVPDWNKEAIRMARVTGKQVLSLRVNHLGTSYQSNPNLKTLNMCPMWQSQFFPIWNPNHPLKQIMRW